MDLLGRVAQRLPDLGWRQRLARHVAGTWGPEGVKVYVDGVLAGTHSYSGAASNYATELIGTSAWGGYFGGSIDDLRIWNYARSESEIQADMNEPLGPEIYESAASGLIAYYRFDEFEDLGAGSAGGHDIRDASVSGNHAATAGGVSLSSGMVPTESSSWSALKGLYGR